LYFVNNKAASNEIINNLKGIFSRYQEACLVGGCDYDDVNETGNKDLPEKTCSDNLIVFDEIENETRVWQENNCVYISGNYILGADAFLYNVFGIKE
jgi:hypothetical protein